MPRSLSAAFVALAWPAALAGQAPDESGPAAPADSASRAPVVTFGAFVDVYYAWDTGQPREFDRPYTTQPARHNEFNVNLAHVEARVAHDRVRGRLALQAGTSVQANYAGEPAIGAVSGPTLARHIQEAWAGVRVAPGLWVDGGIYFSYIGFEGWISRDNPTYTRSLVADYTPYYLSGARLTWEAAPRLTAQLHVVNGWQNISENNGDKAIGARVDWQATRALAVGYSAFRGNEQPDSLPGRTRWLHQVLVRVVPGRGWEFQGVFDLGWQAVPDGEGQTWYGASLIGRKALSPRVKVVARAERYADRHQVIVVTGGPDGFETWSGSLGVDVQVAPRVLWRTEARGYRSGADLWPGAGVPASRPQGAVLVSSLALTL